MGRHFWYECCVRDFEMEQRAEVAEIFKTISRVAAYENS